ncbi:MAG: NUDIX hydrolase [Clostridia bacterium]|nr:NUDIX hydrolase [Clostridia bacterium]
MKDSELTEKIVSRQLIYDGAVVHLEKWRVELPNGREAVREAIYHVGAVAVVACDEGGNIAMVKQYRVVPGRLMLEIPAGKLDGKGEDHLLAAKRELSEETGLDAENWTHMTDVITTPGFCDERIALYLATGLRCGNNHPDEDEFLNAYFMPAKELYDMIYSKELCDAKSVCALLFARPLLAKMGLIDG